MQRPAQFLSGVQVAPTQSGSHQSVVLRRQRFIGADNRRGQDPDRVVGHLERVIVDDPTVGADPIAVGRHQGQAGATIYDRNSQCDVHR